MMKQKKNPQQTAALKIRADVQVGCFTEGGIEVIRETLLAGQNIPSTVPIKIQLVVPPTYSLFTTTHDKTVGLSALTSAIEAIKQKASTNGTDVIVKTSPYVTNPADEPVLESDSDSDSDSSSSVGEVNEDVGMDIVEDVGFPTSARLTISEVPSSLLQGKKKKAKISRPMGDDE